MQSGKPPILIVLLLAALSFRVSGQVDFTVSETSGCDLLKVKYTFTCAVDTFTSFYWDFGNGETSTLRDPDTVVYNIPNTYTPALVFNNRPDQMIVKPDLIQVHRTVPATFNTKDTVTYNYYVLWHDLPLDAGVNYTFNWNIEEFAPRTGRRQEVTFPRQDTFTVSLTVADEFGCTSTDTRDIFVLEEIVVPNVFTPNGDQFNSEFQVTSNGGFPIRMRIFTRSGVLVHESEGFIVSWNGKTANGVEVSTGIYYYTIEALWGDPDKRYSKAGFVHLYR